MADFAEENRKLIAEGYPRLSSAGLRGAKQVAREQLGHSMIAHMDKAKAVADKVAKKAEDALADLECEMALRKWPAEFRAIMWDAVAAIAARRAQDNR